MVADPLEPPARKLVLEDSQRLTTKMGAPHRPLSARLGRGIKLAKFQRGGLTTARFQDNNPQSAEVAIGELLDASEDRLAGAPGLQHESTWLECYAPLTSGKVEQLKFVLHQNGVAERIQEGLNLFLELAERFSTSPGVQASS